MKDNFLQIILTVIGLIKHIDNLILIIEGKTVPHDSVVCSNSKLNISCSNCTISGCGGDCHLLQRGEESFCTKKRNDYL